jgi:putative aldouronate transport system substrate-binding protein
MIQTKCHSIDKIMAENGKDIAAEQKKADWILNGGIDEEWDSYLKKMEKYGLSDYLSIKQKYFDQYQDSLSSEK